MKDFFIIVISWIEVWGLLIPMIIIFKKPVHDYCKPIKWYVLFSFPIYLLIDVITQFKSAYHFPHWLQTNNYLYNLISIIRFLTFNIFFIRLKQPFLVRAKKIAVFIFILFVFVNFLFFDSFFDFYFYSNRLLAVESVMLLLLCLQYYFFTFYIKDSPIPINERDDFWIVTGLAIFIVISFPIHIFYRQLVIQSKNFGIDIWQLQNIAFLISCIFIAIGLNKVK